MRPYLKLKCISAALGLALIFAGCSGSKTEEAASDLTPVTLQTDWYAQAEHGGFYQALAEGYYEAVGLDVTIDQGGPNSLTTQKVASRKADFSIGRADDILIHYSNDIPIVIVGALMQRDPQALLVHEESDIDDFEDLDGRTVMTTPGAPMIQYLERKYGITINITPIDYGMSRFLADKNFIQQCFITNEPYYVRKEGANPKTMLIAYSGYNPYRVIYANRNFASANPDVVKAFVAASIKGWDSYLEGPRDKADAIIAASNPKMTEEFLNYSVNAMKENQLVSGEGPREATGLIDPLRIQELIDTLLEIGLIDEPIDASKVAPLDYLPESLRTMVTG